jgi:hypothetical protein
MPTYRDADMLTQRDAEHLRRRAVMLLSDGTGNVPADLTAAAEAIAAAHTP